MVCAIKTVPAANVTSALKSSKATAQSLSISMKACQGSNGNSFFLFPLSHTGSKDNMLFTNSPSKDKLLCWALRSYTVAVCIALYNHVYRCDLTCGDVVSWTLALYEQVSICELQERIQASVSQRDFLLFVFALDHQVLSSSLVEAEYFFSKHLTLLHNVK